MLQAIPPHLDHPRTPRSPSPFTAASHASDNKAHLLLCASGSVASIKIPCIARALSHHASLSILIILTRSASAFLSGQSAEQPHHAALAGIPNVDGVFLDEDEWSVPWRRGNSILHIELRRWAHLMVVAPLSANTLAKITGGFSDNLLTSVVRAWDTTGLVEAGRERGRRRKRILVAPAMNTAMWRHPVTARQVRVLEGEWGVKDGEGEGEGEEDGWFEVLRPMEKELACGDVGDGAMMDWKNIVGIIEARLGLKG